MRLASVFRGRAVLPPFSSHAPYHLCLAMAGPSIPAAENQAEVTAADNAGKPSHVPPPNIAASTSSAATTMKTKNRPSAEEIEAKRKQRAEKKLREAEEKEKQAQLGIVGVGKDGKVPFHVRHWSAVREVAKDHHVGGGRKVRILSWNILAQGLVRRKLFPGSDCLKWKEREEGLTSEMVSHNWDIGAFQEVDRVDVHGPNLEKSGRSYVYAKGYDNKQHGLLIAWRTGDANQGAQSTQSGRSTLFEKDCVASKLVFFDRENVDAQGNTSGSRRALSRVTRNVGLFVALRFKSTTSSGPAGVIVGTTHLFWHPMHAYERVRQMGIMKRRMVDWRDEHEEWSDWPMFLAGDFNDQPHSATYKLVTGDAMTQHCLDEVRQSSVVHSSVDALTQSSVEDGARDVQQSAMSSVHVDSQKSAAIEDETKNESDEEDEQASSADDEEGEDDQVLKNCRLATDDDGLLSFEELMQLHDLSRSPPSSKRTASRLAPSELVGQRAGLGISSLYGQHFHRLESDQKDNFFGSPGRGRERHDDPDWTPNTPNPHLHSSYEPMYTLYSSLFCLTLDYIFLFPPKQNNTAPVVTALLPTHTTEVLQPGVPRRTVCASDHVAIGAEVIL